MKDLEARKNALETENLALRRERDDYKLILSADGTGKYDTLVENKNLKNKMEDLRDKHNSLKRMTEADKESWATEKERLERSIEGLKKHIDELHKQLDKHQEDN